MRVKRGNVLRKRHKKILKLAKGFQGARSRIFKVANTAVMKALKYQYRDRRSLKRNMRRLWIVRINAAVSIGAPGAPGVGLICMTVLISQIGGPAEAVTLVMGLYPLVDMMGTCANVTGDAVGTVIVARRAKLLDMEKYNS